MNGFRVKQITLQVTDIIDLGFILSQKNVFQIANRLNKIAHAHVQCRLGRDSRNFAPSCVAVKIEFNQV